MRDDVSHHTESKPPGVRKQPQRLHMGTMSHELKKMIGTISHGDHESSSMRTMSHDYGDHESWGPSVMITRTMSHHYGDHEASLRGP